MSEIKFEGQVALVTGATRGIGAAIALELAQRGLKVIGTATSQEGAARIEQALSAFAGCGGRVLNVTDAAAAESLIDAVVKEHGGLQVLVNNGVLTLAQDTTVEQAADLLLNALTELSAKKVETPAPTDPPS